MLTIVRSNQFKKDVKRLTRSGSKDMSRLREVIIKLVNEEKLDPKYRNHPLVNNWKGCLECHIGPDWLLIYRINKKQMNLNWLEPVLIPNCSKEKPQKDAGKGIFNCLTVVKRGHDRGIFFSSLAMEMAFLPMENEFFTYGNHIIHLWKCIFFLWKRNFLLWKIVKNAVFINFIC